MICYEEYTHLISKGLYKFFGKSAMDGDELRQIKAFEHRQPDFCPYCGRPVKASLDTPFIVHDLQACKKSGGLRF